MVKSAIEKTWICPSCGLHWRYIWEKPVCYCRCRVETVDHPDHYNSHPSGVECIAIIEHFMCNVALAIKHLWRHGLKGDALEDLKKAEWYVRREIERLKKDESFRVPDQDCCSSTLDI